MFFAHAHPGGAHPHAAQPCPQWLSSTVPCVPRRPAVRYTHIGMFGYCVRDMRWGSETQCMSRRVLAQGPKGSLRHIGAGCGALGVDREGEHCVWIGRGEHGVWIGRGEHGVWIGRGEQGAEARQQTASPRGSLPSPSKPLARLSTPLRSPSGSLHIFGRPLTSPSGSLHSPSGTP
eukprot:351204-Chlamydomonas_euryale.AAC.13